MLDVDDTQLGGNLGFGLMALDDPWVSAPTSGIFTEFGGEEDGLDAIDSNDFLSEVDF